MILRKGVGGQRCLQFAANMLARQDVAFTVQTANVRYTNGNLGLGTET